MDRNREARRGSMAAMNGGLSRRRQQRSTNLRDSPEEDGVMEMRESSRLRDRDRGIKKDRDRSGGGSRSKRRRGERLIHGSNRDEGDDSSEESLDDEDDEEEEEAAVSVRFPPPPPPPTNPTPSSSSSLQQQQQQQSQNNHVRRSITSKLARPPAPSWKVAEEMIGVSIPRKARTSTLKRPQECGGGGSGELIHRQASTSPSRRSPSSNTAVSPSSSNVSVRKKKPISGSKHRPPKSKSSSIQEIEIEVAEVLYGMTRQAPAPPVLSSSMQDTNGLSNEAKSIPRVSSPGSFSPPTSQPSVLPTPNLNSSNNSAPLVTTAPKRKRPRLKSEDESPTSPAMKLETELPPKPEEGSAPVSPSRSEKKMVAAAASPAIENGSTALTDVCTAAGGDHMQESAKPESSGHVPEQKEAKEEIVLAATSKSKEAPCSNLNVKLDEATVVKDGSEAMKVDSPREEKFSIDLMAPPPPSLGNSERDGLLDYASDHKPVEPVKEMRLDIAKGEMEKLDRSSKQQEANEAASAEDIVNKHVPTEKPMLDLQLDLEKQDKDAVSLGSSSKHQQQSKQQPKVPRIDPKQEKKAQSAASSSLPLTMPIAGWPGGFPHFGYMGQGPTLPAVMPMDGSSAASKTLQPPHFFPPQKMKRCATHCYIAKTINYNQQIARMNPFWPPAAAAAAAAAVVGTSPMYGAKQHNLNLVPPPEAAILGNPLQGSFPGRSLGPLQEKASPAVAMTYAASPPAKEKSSAAAAAAAANNPLIEAQRKQFLLQQTPQPVSSAAGPNMLHGPAAFIFPVGQQPAAAAAATRPGTAKSTPGIGNAAPSTASGSSIAASSGPAGHSTTTMSFNYSGLQPSESQYLAFLQNNGYALTMPAHLGGGPPYRGANPSQAMPFFNGSFYSSPMLHPSSQQQFRQQQQQQQSPATHQQPPAHSQQGHQNTSTSSGSSSSQKHHTKQQQRAPGGGAAAGATPAGGNNHNFSAKQHLHLLPPQARQLESEAGCEDSPSTADSSRASQAQKSIYGNFAMSIHPQNFAMLSPAAAALPSSGSGGGGSHNDKQQPVQNQANLTPSQAYAMSFAPFGGPAAAAAAGGAQGLDFTSMVQNHALFHSLPESVRHHGYQQITAVAAAAVAAQLAQHKKSHHEDGKSVGDAGAASANVTSEEGKMMASTGKSPGGVAQHSLSFSRPDNDLKASTILGNNSNIPEGSSRTLNLIQPPANGVRASNRPSSAAPATSSPVVANTANPTAGNLHMQSSQQQQQHLIQLQKSQQQQQQLQLQQQMSSRSTTKGSSHSTNNATIYSDRMAAGSMSRFSGFPPSIIQSASPAQSPQWKASGRSATPGPANSATTSSSSAKNQLQQQQQQQHHQHQQGRNQQQHQQALLGSNVHQTQISFGVSSSKAVGVSGQPLLASNSSLAAASAAAAAIAAGSPQSSVSKSSAGNGGGGGSGGNGSPRASSSSKPGQPPPTLLSPALPLHQQPPPAAKNSPSPSSSNLKSSSPANNRNMTSILGHPQITPAANSSSSTKFQQQQQQQQKQQSFHQPQLFFSHPYLQAAQSSQSNAAAAHANFYQQQRRHSEQQSQQHSQQQQQQQQNSTSSGVLSLCPSSLTLAGSSPTSDPAKAARPKPQGDQKAAPGSENLHWKPEKR